MRGRLCFPFSPRKGPRTKGPWAAHLACTLRCCWPWHTAPHHPQPTGGLCWGPCGSGGHCIGRKTPRGRHNSTKEAAAGQQPSSSALPIPRPGGPQVAPWPPQTPKKTPQGTGTSPLLPLGAMGGLWGHQKSANGGPSQLRISAGHGARPPAHCGRDRTTMLCACFSASSQLFPLTQISPLVTSL